MKLILRSLPMLIALIALSTFSNAQTLINQDWFYAYGIPDSISWGSSTTDIYGNFYTIGNTVNASGNTDALVSMYDSQGELIWQTTTELNNSHFEIEQSTDSRTWQNIGQVTGAGTSNEIQNYTFTDKTPQQGINYYRLKQIDYDGQFEYSEVVTASLKSGLDFSIGEIVPNPSKENTQVRVNVSTGKEETIYLSVYNAIGMKVVSLNQNLTVGLNNISINTTKLSSGTYYINFEGTFGRETKKLIVIK